MFIKRAFFIILLILLFIGGLFSTQTAKAQTPPPASRFFRFYKSVLGDFFNTYSRKITVKIEWKENGLPKSTQYTTIIYRN